METLINSFIEYGYRDKIFFIDDGSTDNSEEILIRMDIPYRRFSLNRGKGRIIKYIFEELIVGLDFFIIMDSDLQHRPSDLNKFITTYRLSGKPVFGRRDLDSKDMPWDRKFSNKVTTKFLRFITKKKIYDSQCGFRLYPSECVNDIVITTDRFETESEIIIKLSRKGITFSYVDIPTIYNNNSSKISRLKDIYRFVKLAVRSLIIK